MIFVLFYFYRFYIVLYAFHIITNFTSNYYVQMYLQSRKNQYRDYCKSIIKKRQYVHPVGRKEHTIYYWTTYLSLATQINNYYSQTKLCKELYTMYLFTEIILLHSILTIWDSCKVSFDKL